MSDGRATPGTVSEHRLLTHVRGSPQGRCSASSLDDHARLVLPPQNSGFEDSQCPPTLVQESGPHHMSPGHMSPELRHPSFMHKGVHLVEGSWLRGWGGNDTLPFSSPWGTVADRMSE